MTFSDLNLIPPLLKAAHDAGYETPSPIQQQAIPPVLTGRDLLGCAQTGTGKTAAFAMPILQRLFTSPACGGGKRPIRALILTPTRELALQIDESFRAYGKYMKLRPCVIFGGVGQKPQVDALRAGVDILTATPGRLNDLIGQGHIHLQDVEIFVLDEADRMLDMGFVNDVKRVIRYLPQQRQTLLFSATMPREIEQLADGLLHKPAKVMVTPPATTVEKIDQSLYYVDKGNKRPLLASLLRDPAVTSALVFTRTKHGADRVVKELAHDGITAMAIHGNKSQNARQDALGKFKEGSIGVLVATDIAARGIDVSGLSHVFNYDLPNIPETYVHRIGRTGRAGEAGVAVSFCNFDELEYLADIEKLIKIKVPVVEHAWPMQIMVKTEKQTQQRPPRAARQPAQEKSGRGKQAVETPKKKESRALPQKAKLGPEAQTQSRGRLKRADAAVTIQSEEATMDENNNRNAAAQGQPADGAQDGAKSARRRRGGRRHNKKRVEDAAQPQQGAAPAAPARSMPQNSPKNQPSTPRVSMDERPQPRPQQRPAQNSQPRAAAAQANGAQTAAPRQKTAPQLSQRDDSIQVISRKAPAQKFASFEDYMKARVGTAESGSDDE